MAPRVASNTAAVDSESEDDLAAAAAISSVENRRAAQNTLAVTKFGKAMRRNSTTKAPIKRKAPAAKQSRQALKDRTNHAEGSEDEENDNADEAEMEIEEPKPKAKRAKTTAASKKKAATQAASEPVEEVAKPAAKRTRTTKRAASPEPQHIIPETQQDPGQMEDVSHTIEGADEVEAEPAPVVRQTNGLSSRQRSVSVQPLQPRASARSASAQPGYPG